MFPPSVAAITMLQGLMSCYKWDLGGGRSERIEDLRRFTHPAKILTQTQLLGESGKEGEMLSMSETLIKHYLLRPHFSPALTFTCLFNTFERLPCC